MQKDELILADEFCSYYSVNIGIVQSLQQMGLVEMVSVEEKPYIPHSQLQRLEQLLRLHAELDINPEGLDVVCNLLEKMKAMQSEINFLKSRLRSYEDF